MPHINSELPSTRLILPARQWINDHSNHYLERLQDNFQRRALTAHNSAEQADLLAQHNSVKARQDQAFRLFSTHITQLFSTKRTYEPGIYNDLDRLANQLEKLPAPQFGHEKVQLQYFCQAVSPISLLAGFQRIIVPLKLGHIHRLKRSQCLYPPSIHPLSTLYPPSIHPLSTLCSPHVRCVGKYLMPLLTGMAQNQNNAKSLKVISRKLAGKDTQAEDFNAIRSQVNVCSQYLVESSHLSDKRNLNAGVGQKRLTRLRRKVHALLDKKTANIKLSVSVDNMLYGPMTTIVLSYWLRHGSNSLPLRRSMKLIDDTLWYI
jgi:hypothetical protein